MKAYKEYCTIRKTLVRYSKDIINEQALAKDKRYFGFFSLISNETLMVCIKNCCSVN